MTWIPDVEECNRLLWEWQEIARDCARKCRYKERGECLVGCRGLAICETTGLIVIPRERGER